MKTSLAQRNFRSDAPWSRRSIRASPTDAAGRRLPGQTNPHTSRLQTNGILLHRHDHGKMRDAGLTMLSLSVDTFDPTVFKQLRGGTSLARVKSNLIQFHEHCPNVSLVFVTTVTSLK